jgi:hypothetical protein
MNDCLINIRFGVRHLQLTKKWKLSFEFNEFHVANTPKKWFEIYTFFNFNGKLSEVKRDE